MGFFPSSLSRYFRTEALASCLSPSTGAKKMGSSYFSRCSIGERFTSARRYPLAGGGDKWLIYDWDQRRSVDVCVPEEVEEDFVFKAVKGFINDLPANVVQVEISKDGELSFNSSNPFDDRSWVPFYPPRTDFPREARPRCAAATLPKLTGSDFRST